LVAAIIVRAPTLSGGVRYVSGLDPRELHIMARRRNPPELVRTKWELADRLRTIRTELFGERGLAELARQIGVPVRTWYSYETGVTVPAEVLLRFVELTLVEPVWLLHGRGPKYQMPLDELISHGAAGFRGEVDDAERHVQNGEDLFGRVDGASLRVIAPAVDLEDARADAAMELLDAVPGGSQPRSEALGSRLVGDPCSWVSPHRMCRCIRMGGDAMAPILADGAFVAFAEAEEDTSLLDGKLVVARIDGLPIVRWLHRSGHYALLRAENPAFEPRTQLIDLDRDCVDRPIRRVLWVGTGH
jgi:hypothetical protein